MGTMINRREFSNSLGRAATVAGLGFWSGRTAHANKSPNEKLNLAIIGAGGRGEANVREVAEENIVALCDVDDRRAGRVFEQYHQAERYQDFRKMIDDLHSTIDAVVISAPNHIHVPASVAAMQMGLHCYCEKPLAHSVSEARLAATVARENGVATQMGTQIHASENFRRVVELIQTDAIGTIEAVNIRLAGGGTAGDRPSEQEVIPEGLDWDLWLGPAPTRPYHPCYVPHDWHYWWDFGGGPLGNMGCHYLDLAFWALQLEHPVAITSTGSAKHDESTPAHQKVEYEFHRVEDLNPLKLTWEHGRRRTEFWDEHDIPDWTWGVFVGSKGMLLTDYNQHQLRPESDFNDFERPEPFIPSSIGHHQEWIEACKNGSETSCHFGYAGPLTETVLLGNVAFRFGSRIEWDAESMRVTNAPDAQRYLSRDYRDGWDPVES